MPYGPPILWPETVIAASPEAAKSIGELAERLHRVGVQRDAELPGDLGEFVDRLDGADLVVGPHDGERAATSSGSRSMASRSASGCTRPYSSTGSHSTPRALVVREPVARVQHGVVLDRAGEDPGPGRVGGAAGPVAGP